MNRRAFSLTAVFAAAVLLCFAGAFSASAADASGTWKWSTPGRGDNAQPRETTLTLKQEGEKLTGTVKSGGQNAQEVAITDGTIKNGEVSFKVTRKMQDREFTITYTGKLDGDTIKGKTVMGEGDRKRERDWEAKRVK